MSQQQEFDFGPQDYSSLGTDIMPWPSISPLTTLDIASLNTMNANSTYNIKTGNVTIPSSWNMNTSGTVYTTNTTGTVGSGSIGLNPIWTNTTPAPPNLVVDGDIKWNGRSLGKLLEKIEDRLAILTEPTPERLERFAALREAYDAYKLIDTLCVGEGNKDSR
jgi:hypothetical protein